MRRVEARRDFDGRVDLDTKRSTVGHALQYAWAFMALRGML